MLEFKPDLEAVMERMQAFWSFDVLDRPLVQMPLWKPPSERVPPPAGQHADPAARWLDAGYQAELALAALASQDFLGDTLPVAFPNLGPEIMAALYGCPLHFGDYGTSWSDPILSDWASADQVRLDWQHPYLLKLLEITDALLEIGKDKFITGMSDWHPGGDCLAALCDPQNLAVDLITHPQQVKTLLARIQADYFKLYDLFYDKLRAAGQPISTWTPLASTAKYYLPSNDFSIMVSNKMFCEFFLDGIAAECRFLDCSIYHLDGPGALRHLDSILSIPQLNALQWVPGAGNEGFARWIGVYQKAQAARKGIQVTCRVSELNLVMQTLDRRGLFLRIEDVPDRQTAANILAALEKW